MKTKSLLFCFVFAVYTNIHTANAQVNGQDSLALVDLYNSTNGPNWFNHTNWLTSNPVKTWYGIKVSKTRVTTIKLTSDNLDGSIPSSLGNLKPLYDLELDNNQLRGSIPSSLGNLSHLYILVLKHNQLSGNIPLSFGNLLSTNYLLLSDNQLSGNIPSSLGNLYNLFVLVLGNNQLSGRIPSSFGNLNVHSLDLGNNQLNGSIPSSLANDTHLDVLNLSNNHFTFNGMELIAQRFPFATYAPQKNIPTHQIGNTLSVSAGGILSHNTYKWFRRDGTTSTLVATIKGDSTFHPSESGEYRVVVSNSVATQLQLYSKLYDYTTPNNTLVASAKNELKESDKANSLRIYPNPAKDILHVETNGAATFSLIDQSGKILVITNITGKGSINISGITPGLYYLKNNSTGSVQKVVIAR